MNIQKGQKEEKEKLLSSHNSNDLGPAPGKGGRISSAKSISKLQIDLKCQSLNLRTITDPLILLLSGRQHIHIYYCVTPTKSEGDNARKTLHNFILNAFLWT